MASDLRFVIGPPEPGKTLNVLAFWRAAVELHERLQTMKTEEETGSAAVPTQLDRGAHSAEPSAEAGPER